MKLGHSVQDLDEEQLGGNVSWLPPNLTERVRGYRVYLAESSTGDQRLWISPEVALGAAQLKKLGVFNAFQCISWHFMAFHGISWLKGSESSFSVQEISPAPQSQTAEVAQDSKDTAILSPLRQRL